MPQTLSSKLSVAIKCSPPDPSWEALSGWAKSLSVAGSHLPDHGSVRITPLGLAVSGARLRHMAKRAFTRADTPEKATDYHGACRYSRLSPDVAAKGVKSINVELTLEEALKLHLALQSCLHGVNRYNRSTTRGRAMGVVLSVKTDGASIAVIEAPVRSAQTAINPGTLKADGI